MFDKSPAADYTTNMTVDRYRHWLQKKIQELDSPEPDIAVCEGAATIVEEAAATALVLGLTDLYRRCRFKGQLDDGTSVLSPGIAREILSECLAGLPTEPTATITIKQLAELTGWSRTTIYRRREEGKLPEPRNNGGKLYWLRSELGDIL